VTGIISRDGLEIVAGTNLPAPKFLLDRDCKVTDGGWFSRNYACGHRGLKKFKVSVYGRLSTWIRQNAECPQCFLESQRKVYIVCARCGSAIGRGDHVALYHKSSNGLHLEVATYWRDGVIGCFDAKCCPHSSFFEGYWRGQSVQSVRF